MTVKWSEKLIAGALVRGLFDNQVLAVPQCSWTGNECDILIVTKDLRIIDVEIKIDRGDLKADVHKDKWWRSEIGRKTQVPVNWPAKVWKHYYAMPRKVWHPDLANIMPEKSGILLLDDIPERTRTYGIGVSVYRACKPNRDAKKIGAEAVLDIARLANLRMWSALQKIPGSLIKDVLEVD